MRVLVVCPTYPPNDVPCGVGDFTGALAPRLVARGASVTVAASTGYVGPSTPPVSVVRVAERWDRPAVGRLVALALRERFDVVNVQYTPEIYGRGPWLKALPAWLRVRGGPPVVVSAHTLVGGYRTAKWLAPLLLAPARRIITANREVIRLIDRWLPVLRARVREIPIGASIPLGNEPRDAVRARVRAALSLEPEAPVIAHFGFLYPGKGIETLLGAAARLRARGTAFTLLMLGGAWPGAEAYCAGLQASARAAGLGDAVRWLGHLDAAAVDTYLTAADAAAFPYDGGLSARRSTLLAAFTHGLATISTPPVEPDARFRDGENVLLVPPRDETALAEALARLLASPWLRTALGAGAAKLAPEFSWDTIAEATLGVYEEAMA